MDTIKKVEKFHELFKQPINRLTSDISQEVRKLRIKLIFEELYELAEAGDLKDYFTDLCEAQVKDWNSNNWKSDGSGVVDRIEELDALIDLRYVCDGAVIALGFKEIFGEGFDVVHASNLSKVIPTHRLQMEKNRWEEQGYIVFKERINAELCLLKRADGKVLKPMSYVEVNLEPLVSAQTVKEREEKTNDDIVSE